jgi:hypothetical protein
MTIIQPLLLVLLLAGLLAYFGTFRSKLTDRVIVLALAIAAVLLIVHPDWAILLAAAVGVGRGVDLIIYLTLFGYAFTLLIVLSKIRNLEAMLIELSRAIALTGARLPVSSNTSPDGSAPDGIGSGSGGGA